MKKVLGSTYLYAVDLYQAWIDDMVLTHGGAHIQRARRSEKPSPCTSIKVPADQGFD